MQIEHFFSPNSGEDQKKKRFSTRIEHFFSPKFTVSCTPIQNIGGVADVDHSQTIGGDAAKLLEGIYPPPPPPPPPPRVSAPLPIYVQLYIQYNKTTEQRIAVGYTIGYYVANTFQIKLFCDRGIKTCPIQRL